MRVLTVRQPWASQIIAGTKRIENRSWRPPGALRIAIHAGQHRSREVREGRFEFGVILGTVFVSGAHDGDECDGTCRYADGALSRYDFDLPLGRPFWHWELTSPREFVTPIPRVRGALGLWAPSDSVAHLIDIAEVRR